MKTFFFAFLFTMILSLSTHAIEPSPTFCPKGAELTDLNQKLAFESSSSLVTQNNWNTCQNGSPATVLLEALSYLRKVAKLPHLQNKRIDQGILGDDAWGFLTDRIDTVNFTKNGEGLCGDSTQSSSGVLNVAAYVSTNEDPSTIHACDFIKDLDPIDMASVLIHEARHHDGYQHVNCNRGPLTGAKLACDPSYSTGGSYAVGVEFQARLSQSQGADPLIRNSMRLQAVTDLWQRFNKLPFEFKSGILLYDSHGQLLYYDGKTLLNTDKKLSLGVLATRYAGNVFYDPYSNSVESFELNKWTAAKGIFANDFKKNNLLRRDSTELKDVLYSNGEYSCFLFEQLLKCIDNNDTGNKYFNIPLTQFKASGFLYRSSSSSLINSKIPYLISEDGYLYSMPAELKELQTKGEISFQRTAKPYDYKKIVKIEAKSGEYVLNGQGQLLYTEDGAAGLKIVPGFKDKKFKSIAPIAPWSEELNDL